jgi:pimeloyl-ACP methyl ester carboxylesterase
MLEWEHSDMAEAIVVIADDGTKLRVVRTGSGHSVVLVHGTAWSKGDWLEVVRALSTQFELTSYDRRGRGDSEDGDRYSIEREIEDVLAVIEASNPPVHLVGHSFGAILCLFAAARAGSKIDKLVLYEPPLGAQHVHVGWLDALQEMVDRGELDAAISQFAAAASITDDELRTLESSPGTWAHLRDGVRVAAREIRAAKAALPVDERVLGAISVPTLVLLGDEQDHPSYTGLHDLAAQLPSGRLERVPGRHLALVFAAQDFTGVLRGFLGFNQTFAVRDD